MFKLVVLSALVALVAAKPGYLSSPLAYSVPLALPAATSHQYRSDVISKPVVATYAATPIVSAPVWAAPAVQQAYIAAPYSAAVSHQSRVDVHSGLVAPHVAYASAPVVAW